MCKEKDTQADAFIEVYGSDKVFEHYRTFLKKQDVEEVVVEPPKISKWSLIKEKVISVVLYKIAKSLGH